MPPRLLALLVAFAATAFAFAQDKPSELKYKTEKDIRAAGKLRVEGKEYVMRDGDICHFLFNK